MPQVGNLSINMKQKYLMEWAIEGGQRIRNNGGSEI